MTTGRARSRGSRAAQRCRRKFLEYFPDGFDDAVYLETERAYKEQAHLQWKELLGRAEMDRLIAARNYAEVAARAVRIESRTNLLFSFEKMALRDAVRSRAGAELFAVGLRALIHGRGKHSKRFESFGEVLDQLPRRQTRVHTWPLHTVFGFIARPDRDIFFKPRVTRRAAEAYGFDLEYRSRPDWPTYASLLDFAHLVARDLADLRPRDMIDLQSFIWVQGSDEYAD